MREIKKIIETYKFLEKSSTKKTIEIQKNIDNTFFANIIREKSKENITFKMIKKFKFIAKNNEDIEKLKEMNKYNRFNFIVKNGERIL